MSHRIPNKVFHFRIHQHSRALSLYVALLFILLGGVLFVRPHTVHAALYNANGLLGHVDGNGNPIYVSGGANNGPNAEGFNLPSKIVLDPVNHRLFVAEQDNNRVLVFNLDSTNNIATTTAAYVLGQTSFTSSAGATTQNGLSNPIGLAYDSTNSRLFVADGTNRRILVFNVATSTITNGENAMNVLGQTSFTSSRATTTQSGFQFPGGLAYDSTDNLLFVGDINAARVMVFNVATSTITNGENAMNVLGQTSFTSSTGALTQSGLDYPYDVAYDPTNNRLFVGQYGYNRVSVFNVATSTITNGENAVNVLGQNNFTSYSAATSQSGLNFPTGLAYDSINNRLFVSGYYNNRVTIFNVATSTITNGENAVNVLGQTSFTSSAGATNQNELNAPYGMDFDPTNNRLFIVDQDNYRVMVFNVATSTITNGENATAGLGQVDANGNFVYTQGGADGGASAQGIFDPYTSALDASSHRLFVLDTGNNRVLVFNLDSTNNIATTTAAYVLGQTSFTSSIATTTQNGLNDPAGAVYDPTTSRLFVSDALNNRVMVFNVATSTITNGENAVNVLGQTSFTSSIATTTQSGLYAPIGLDFDSVNSRLFVADFNNCRTLVFNVATSTITNGENAVNVLGQTSFTSSTAYYTQNGLPAPTAVSYDPTNSRLFVTGDYHSNRVLVFNVATSTITNGENAVNVLGQTSFTSSTAAISQNGLYNPYGLAYDPTHSNLFVADGDNARVMVFNVATSTITNGENAVNVLGQTSFTSSIATTTQGGLGGINQALTLGPFGVAYDSTNNHLFVTDTYNSRVVEYTFVTIVTPSVASGMVGQPYSTTISATSTQGVVNYSLFSGSLPPGLSLNTSSGVISGTPTATGTYAFIIEADDNFSTGDFFDRATYTLQVGNISASLTSPTNGATVSGTTNITATTTSTFGIASIQFYLDSSPLGEAVTATSSPNTYMTSWNTAGLTNGSHTLLAVATDNNGNVATSSPVSVTVTNVVSSGGGGGGSVYYSLSLATSGSGSGTITGAGLTCGPGCGTSLISSQTISLTATTDVGSVFVGWSGACSPSGTSTVCGLTMTADQTANAIFDLLSTTSTLESTSVPSTTVAPASSSAVSLPSPTSPSIPIRLVDNSGTFYLILNGISHGVTDPGILNSYGLNFSNAVPATSADLSLPQGSLLLPDDGALVKTAQNLTVYLISGQQRHGFASASVFLGLGFAWSSVITVTAPELNLPIGTIVSNPDSQHLPGQDINKDATIYYIGQDDQLHGYPSLAAYNSWHIANDFSVVVPANAADMALPVGSLVNARVLQ
jgi:DNA-binding beta-propeller fold protein YncE